MLDKMQQQFDLEVENNQMRTRVKNGKVFSVEQNSVQEAHQKVRNQIRDDTT